MIEPKTNIYTAVSLLLLDHTKHTFMHETGRELEAICEYEHKLRDRLIYLDVEEGRLARMVIQVRMNYECFTFLYVQIYS